MDKMLNELIEKIKALPIDRQAALWEWIDQAENEELNAAEAARLLRIDRQTLIRRIRRGEIDARKDGRNWQIKRQDIDRLKEGKK